MIGLNTKDVPCDCSYWRRPIGHCWWCEFKDLIRDMSEKFDQKWNEYGASYKTCPIKFLITRLEGEMEELQGDLSYDELIDVANVALMLAWRLRERENEKERREVRKHVPFLDELELIMKRP